MDGLSQRRDSVTKSNNHGPTATELLSTPHALLTRSHLRDLGLERRAVDAVFRALPVVVLPGYARPMIRAGDYAALIEASTYRDDRVRPPGGQAYTGVSVFRAPGVPA